MGTKATYTDSRTGKRCTTPTFGSRALAEGYVRGLKGAKDVAYEDTEAAACATVTPVDEGTAERQRAASKAFYAPIAAARRGTVVTEERRDRAEEAEHAAELDREVFGAALASGAGHAAAMDEVNYVRGQRRRR